MQNLNVCSVLDSNVDSAQPTSNPNLNFNRRKFLGRAGAALAATTIAPIAMSGQPSPSGGQGQQTQPVSGNSRVLQAFELRVGLATAQALLPVSAHQTNGDQQTYPDGSATYTKVIRQDSIGLVNPTAYASFTKALNSGRPQDFENIIIGGTRTLNGPQGGLAFTLEGADSHTFGSQPSPGNQENLPVVPAPPSINSPAWGTELAELYWCSLLRDTAFTDYPTSPVAAAASAELTSMPTYAGPRNSSGHVTPKLLFRGGFPGETVGPHISQLLIVPSMFGALPLTNQYVTYQSGLNYMLDPSTFLQVQNGIDTGLVNQPDPTPRYLHNGRGLSSYTHVDVLYQAYFTSFVVMMGMGLPLNPGNLYTRSRTQNGFDTLGGADIAATLGEISAKALDVVWYQKWFVHLRPRPESSGGIAYLTKTNQLGSLQARLNSNFLNSQALAASYAANNSWFLSQPFPEGSPAHPAYPTGHGTVGGACITMLKFFFDGNAPIPSPVVPSSDGLALVPYTGADASQITLNGELNKLAHNITFGHGLHGGIHWRSDSDSSMRLGEAFALSYLRDKVMTYNEPVTVHLTKLDGTTATISNQG
ncbi:MAG: vanadium-dependent haloperoxidase [Acidobacteriaceae bacterium]